MTSNHTERRWRRGIKKATNDFLIQSLPVPQSPNCVFSKEQVLLTAFEAAAHREYLSPYTALARGRGRAIPDADTVGYRLRNLTLPVLVAAIRGSLRLLRAAAKEHQLLAEPLILAADFTEDPHYGRPDPSYIGSRKTKGANYALQFLLLQAVHGPHLLPLDLLPKTALGNDPDLLGQLLDTIRAEFAIGLLLADRAFSTLRYVRVLLDRQIPHVIPVEEDRRMKREILEARRRARYVDGTYGLSVHIDQAFTFGYREKITTTMVYLFRSDEARERPGRTPRPEHFVFLTLGPVTPKEAVARAAAYDHRWGIETGNRDQDALQGKSRAQRAVMQWFWLLFAVVFHGVWVLGRFLWVPPRSIVRWELTTTLFRDLLKRCTRWRRWAA